MDRILDAGIALHEPAHRRHVGRLRRSHLGGPLLLELRVADDRGRHHERRARLVHVSLGELDQAPSCPVADQLVAARAGDALDQDDVLCMLEDRAVPLPEDVPEIVPGSAAGGVVLAHVAEPPGELLMYVNDARTFSVSGSIGVERSSYPMLLYPPANMQRVNTFTPTPVYR